MNYKKQYDKLFINYLGGGRMEKLVDRILDCVWAENDIPEELLYEFTSKAIRMVQLRSLEQLPESYRELEHYVDSFWRAQRFETVDATRVYEMGRLLSLTNMLGMVAEQETEEQSLHEYAAKFRDWYLVFKGIYDTPGVTHKRLAKYARKSDSSLSQFINKNQWSGFYLCRRFGREKYYYLTELGEKLYEVMMSQQPHPTEERYAGYLGVKNNIEKNIMDISNDSRYRVSRTERGGFIENKIYGINWLNTVDRDLELLAEIRMNKQAMNAQKEGNKPCQEKMFLKKLNVR